MPERSRPQTLPGGTILVVDDEEANLNLLQRLLERAGHRVLRARDGDEALEVVTRERPDVVLSDVRMPGRDGCQICQVIKAEAATRLTPVMLMTGAGEADDRLRAIDAGADDLIGKPIDPVELKARIRSLVRLRRSTDDLDAAETVLRNLAMLVESRDPYTGGHCQRLAKYASLLGTRLHFSAGQIATLCRGAYLHDIGMIAIPDAILLKAGPLTADEQAIIRQHPVIGDRLCGTFRRLHHVRPMVRWHHERLDGTGYPDALRGDAIPLLAQILGIVDVFDALTTARPYRQPQPVEQAIARLIEDGRAGRRAPNRVAGPRRIAPHRAIARQRLPGVERQPRREVMPRLVVERHRTRVPTRGGHSTSGWNPSSYLKLFSTPASARRRAASRGLACAASASSAPATVRR